MNSQYLWSTTARRYTFLCALPVDLSFDGGGTVDTAPLDRDDQGASVRDFLTCRRGAQRHAYSLRTIHMPWVIPASFTAVLVVSRCLENNEHFCKRSREIPSDSSAENIRVSAIRACLSKNLEARRPGCRDHERRHWGYTSPPTEGNLQKTTSVEYQK